VTSAEPRSEAAVAVNRALVLAKAPVVGEVKTRLGVVIGMEAAARLASAALLDTLLACEQAFPERHLALHGDLAFAVDGDLLKEQLQTWVVHEQVGVDFAARLARAHADAAGDGVTVVQVGMDTPQVTAGQLRRAAAAVEDGTTVLGPCPDGGWWVLATRDAAAGAALVDVPMSTPRTFELTRATLIASGHRVHVGESLTDVDTVADAAAVAAGLRGGRFLRAWQEVTR
jgi:glycosyltransferase A (GT-A) superfamily protein (DUF2064 family)